MRFKAKATIEKGQLDLVPLVNVMFLLLIFFMITSNFIFQPGISVDLPKVITSDVIQKESLSIVIGKDSRIYIDQDPVDDKGLVERIKTAAKNSRPVLIKADRNASFGKIVWLWDISRQEGVEKINIATTQERGSN